MHIEELPNTKKNRISSIRIDDYEDNRITLPERHTRSIKKPLLIIFSIVVIIVITVLVITQLIYKRPDLFKTLSKNSNKDGISLDQAGKQIDIPSDNKFIKRGKESFSKGYLTDAISEFTNVVESDASDNDKAIALTYLGKIFDEKGQFDKAIDHLNRAKNYNRKLPDIYRELALAYRHKKDFNKAAEYAGEAISLNDKDAFTHILLGNIYFDQGKTSDAIASYEKAAELEPENGLLSYNLASAMLKKGDEAAAIEYYKKAGASDKSGDIAYKAYSQLGVIFLERKQFSEAEKYLKLSTTIRPSDAVARYNLGIAYLRLNKKDQAIEEFKASEEAGEGDAALMENLGETYFSMKDYDRSLAAYEKIRGANTRNVKILSRMGEIYYEKGDLDLALDAYRRITEIEPATENARVAYLNMGNIQDDIHSYDEAIESYKKSLAISDKDDAALYNLGISYKHAGKPELALSTWRRASELARDNPGPLIAIADYYYEKGYYDLAEIDYQKIIKRWPNIQEAHFKIATMYYKRGQYDYAEKAYQKTIEINENGDLARKSFINLALLFARKKPDEKTLDKSRQMLQKSLMIKPGDSEALYALGIILMKNEQMEKAIETFYQALKGAKDTKVKAEIYNNIGKAYYKQKDYRKSLQAFTRGSEEDPSNEEIRLNRRVSSRAYEKELGTD